MWTSLFVCAAFFVSFQLHSIAAFPGETSRVVVNEVYYDHPGRDEGWEYVELYNAGVDTVDLAGWRIESIDGGSGETARLWTGAPGAKILPGEAFCVAGSAREPLPGRVLVGALENGPDAVRLVAATGGIDVLGYGPLLLDGLFEGSPAPEAPAGMSLARRPDGADNDRNASDFVTAAPTPGRRNFFHRDIEVSIASPVELPCRGARFTLVARLRNAGLETFDGRVTLRVAVAGIAGAADSATASRDLRLAPEALDSIAARAVSPAADSFFVEACLTGAPDDWAPDDTAGAWIRPSPGEVVVNEIMYRPGEGECEWIEIVCVAGAARDLAGWTMSDATGSRRLISEEALVLPPFGYLILARDSAAFAARYPRCPAHARSPAGGWPSLNDAERDGIADRVSLRDATGALVEAVSYGDLVGDERGRSIERVSETACGSMPGGVWHRSAARDGATPGAENSTRLRRTPKGSGIAIAPNPFSPARHGDAFVSGALARGETGFRVRIFSIAGIELRRLFAEEGGARIFSCGWDGRDDGGRLLPSGIYVCLVEFIGPGGGVCRREKACVVVAGG